MLSILTPTGDRPEAWAICQRLMAAQIYPAPVKWIIVDDGLRPQDITFERPGWELVVIRPQPPWSTGQNTQQRNLLAGLEHVTDRVVIIEDDDYYPPTWLSTAAMALENNDLVGQKGARYYNVGTRIGREMKVHPWSCLASTAMRGAAIDVFRETCRCRASYIDMHFWRAHGSGILFGGSRVVGIKGLPGRTGIGIGHRDNFRGDIDPDGTLLRAWIGEDADIYL